MENARARLSFIEQARPDVKSYFSRVPGIVSGNALILAPLFRTNNQLWSAVPLHRFGLAATIPRIPEICIMTKRSRSLKLAVTNE
jgi:hypothetical protein